MKFYLIQLKKLDFYVALCYLPFTGDLAFGGGLIATSDIPISAAFKNTISIKESKSISVIRGIDWHALEGPRAVALAETAHPPGHISKTIENPTLHGVLFEY